MYKFMLLAILFVLSCCVYSYPSGPGACIGGQPAVGGLHLLKRRWFFTPRTVISKSYADANVVIRIGAISMTPGNEYSLFTDVAYKISVRGKDIKGLLVRAESLNDVVAKQTMSGGMNTAVARVCDTALTGPSITGISHTENSKKSSLEGTIQFDEATEVYIDVTVVFYNEFWKGASHAYGRFKIKFIDSPL